MTLVYIARPMTAYERILEHIQPGLKLRTPDKSRGQPFVIEAVTPEEIEVRTARGGRVRISLFTFDVGVKYLSDNGCRGDAWLEIKDMGLQMLLNSENDRVRASSYVLAILGAAGLVDLDGSRPNRVRLAEYPRAG